MSNGIDFVIGGKDRASPAFASTANGMKKLESGANRLNSSTKALMATFAPLLAVMAAVKTVMKVASTISDANDAYDKQAESVKGLETALRLHGDATASQSPKLQTLASDLQKLTGVGDEVTLGLMKQAAMMGVSSDELGDMAKASIGLSEAMGTNLEGAMDSIRRAQEGNFMAFERTFPQMKAMTTDAEKLAFVTELASKGLDAKAESADRVAGMGERASGAIGDLMESVGALLAPVRMLINQGLLTLAESLQSVLAPAVEYATDLLESIGPMMDWVKEKVIQGVNLMIGAFTFFEVVIGNLDKIWVVMVSQAELYLLQMSGAVMHALTVQIPAYAAWFGDNFVNLIRDGLMLAFTVVTNHVQKIIDAFRALWDFIASGGTSDVLGQLGEIAGRSYLEGFESSVGSLPEIAGRKISEREKQLADTIGKIGSDLGEEFATKFASRMVGMGDGISDEFSKDIDLKVNKKLNEELGIGGKGGAGQQTLAASESRLLTRGPADKQQNLLDQILGKVKELVATNKNTESASMESASSLEQIKNNTANTTNLVPTP